MTEITAFDTCFVSPSYAPNVPTAKRLVAKFHGTNTLLEHLPAFLKKYTVDLTAANSTVGNVITVTLDLKEGKR